MCEVINVVLVKKIAAGYRVDMPENKVLEEIKKVFNDNGGEFTLEFAQKVPEFVCVKLTLRDGYEFKEWFYTDGSVVWIAEKAGYESYAVYRCYLANATYVVLCYICENEDGEIVKLGIEIYGNCPFSSAVRRMGKCEDDDW
jgi:hypothetical protein